MNHEDAFAINKSTWNARAMEHFESSFYDKHAFAKAKNSLNHYEQDALGDVKGKRLLHLQCHFGQDSLSWAHKGAHVTGVDISDTAIDLAQQLSKELDLPATFICSNVLDVEQTVEGVFDIVFSSYGTIGWLPDLRPWAKMIASKLKIGGIFYLVEFHPIAWMFDYQVSPPVMNYHYNQEEAVYEEYKGSYAAPDSTIESKEYGWNHGIGDVVQSLIDAGLQIVLLKEHDESPYNVFPGMVQKNDMFVLKDQKFPLIFEVKARKPKDG